MNPSGGTELMFQTLKKYVGPDYLNRINLVLSVCDFGLLSDSKPNVLWQHLHTDQYNAQLLGDATYRDRLHSIVFVSEWQRDEFIKTFGVEREKCVVLRNAIDPIAFTPKPQTGKIQLIYTSMPNRGLTVLLDAFTLLDRSDVELTVYSSNVIYGRGYVDAVKNTNDHIFHRCKTHPAIKYKGYGVNAVVRKTLQTAHILAYPSTFPETSCIAAIEAGSAGCKIVTTNFGALPETCGQHATFIAYNSNYNELAESYAVTLNEELDKCREYPYSEQVMWFNERYNWATRAEEWKELIRCVE
jgi:glycosyltransferase involved in cell wall biosynthesis